MSAEVLRRAAAQIRNDRGGVVSRNTQDGRRWLPVADLLEYVAAYAEAGVAPSYTHYAVTVARAYLGESE